MVEVSMYLSNFIWQIMNIVGGDTTYKDVKEVRDFVTKGLNKTCKNMKIMEENGCHFGCDEESVYTIMHVETEKYAKKILRSWGVDIEHCMIMGKETDERLEKSKKEREAKKLQEASN